MFQTEPGKNREQLGFKDAVLSSFRFLHNYKLKPVQQEVTFVRYESSEVLVNVYHGRASYELGVEIGRLKEPEKKLHIFTIVRWAGAERLEGFGKHVMFQVSSREGVHEFVPKLAELVRKYAVPFLHDDESTYRSALEFQAKGWSEYVKEVNLRSTRAKVEVAWHAKDYAQVVELYGPVRKDLTEVEAKKLTYAEKQVLAAESVGSRPSLRKRH